MKSDQEFKADGGKSDPTLFDIGFPVAREFVQATLDYGAVKYEAHSWRKVPDAFNRYGKAAARHRQRRLLSQMIEGNHGFMEADHESGLPHIAHELFNLMAQIELWIKDHPHIDWRKMLEYNDPPTDHKKSSEDVPIRHCKMIYDGPAFDHYNSQDRSSREADARFDPTKDKA